MPEEAAKSGSMRIAKVMSAIESAGIELEQERSRRKRIGESEYGVIRFLDPDKDLVQEVKEEIADCINWLEFLYAKVWIMQHEGTVLNGGSDHLSDRTT